MMSAFMLGNTKASCEESQIYSTKPTICCQCRVRKRSKLEENNFTPGPAKATRAPPTVFCYICSRQYGSKSIGLHEPKCLEKWKAEQAKLPKGQRRTVPVKPDIPLGVGADGTYDAEAVNEARWQASQANLVPCDYCGRTFNPDRLPIHQKTCTPEKPMKRLTKK